ncbi:entericidin EcnA/B family protein [Yersinia rohdei]|uniref:Entericidin B n=1 Tax=Yersinia rohdei TaxID=29485 RepID=A0A0U1HRQ9_YERRO|nr:entericidin A/B family lipoprotein [Yersinia rohdei]AJJ09239.1 entericidin EcnA/B family protein [Yersinia rohdei]EEQ03810.1 Entericidin B [Yersinia rohdei ATCC 43380]MDN0093094.1 entericidin A/B family lipoprotein [Yersinia rohdei]OWF80318.1 ECN family pore-forming entericidin [Yersinia rohdei]CNE35783.1 entericidin B [Yersinia rohdei]
MLKKSIAVIFSLLVIISLSACNTTKGVGKDVQSAGSAIERSAE